MRRSFCWLLSTLVVIVFLSGCGKSSSPVNPTPTPPSTPGTPSLVSVTPTSITVGAAGAQLTAIGANFTSAATVLWDGKALTTTFVSATQLAAVVPASYLSAVGSANITVQDTNGTTGAMTLTISAPVPSISSINPTQTTAGGLPFTLQVTGANFLSGATIQFNGVALPTTLLGTTSLSATVPSSAVMTAGSVPVNVLTPGSGTGPLTSNTVQFTINPLPAGSFVVPVTANDIAADPVRNVIYASVPSTAATYGNSIVTIDASTGTVLGSVFAGSEPNRIAVSDDGQFLYVALDGSSSVQRILLPSMALDIKVSLGSDTFFGPNTALDLQVAPGSPHIWAVSSGNLGVSPAAQKGVTVYDDATPRPTSAGRNSNHGGFDLLLGTITFVKDASTIAGANNESTGFDLYILPISASGVGTIKDYGGAMPGFNNTRIHYEKATGYVYGDNGFVVDPSNGSPVGRYSNSGPMTTDGNLNSAFFATSPSTGSVVLTSFDLTHFTPSNILTMKSVLGNPVHLIRCGVNGIAFNSVSYTYGTATTKQGNVYIVNGTFVKP